MNGYLDIANSWGMWLASLAIIAVVFIQAIRFTMIAFKSGKAIGMEKKQMVAAFRSGITTAIVPSVAILLGLVVMIPSLGLPFPWMRLSVLGSLHYELMASGIAAKEMGFANAAQDPTGQAFANAVWTMSLGIFFGLLIVAFFTPKIKQLKEKIAGGDDSWMRIMTAAAFFGAVGYLVAQPVVQGGAPLVALVGGFVSMALIGIAVQFGKQNWLKEWALALAIIGGIAITGLASKYFGIGA
jgi:hypothetical protein